MSRTELGAKGRVVIPAQVRAQAGLDVGQALVVRAEGVGRIVIETPESIQVEVWAAAPAQVVTDSVQDVRTLRDEDTRRSDTAAECRSQPCEEDGLDEAGTALLAALGL